MATFILTIWYSMGPQMFQMEAYAVKKNVLVSFHTATYFHHQHIHVNQNFFDGIDHARTCLPIEFQSILSLLTHCKG